MGQKWTPEQKAKYKATMAEKRAKREQVTHKVQATTTGSRPSDMFGAIESNLDRWWRSRTTGEKLDILSRELNVYGTRTGKAEN